MKALQGLAFLLLMQSGGEALSHFLKLPVPGPVVGMAVTALVLRLLQPKENHGELR